uniref:Putative orcokinin peptides type a-like neodiprion lecontei n=1 Tax=Xenopsylla cheopis TaxID=163159 RepID=A0A6M2DZ30_XENCH
MLIRFSVLVFVAVLATRSEGLPATKQNHEIESLMYQLKAGKGGLTSKAFDQHGSGRQGAIPLRNLDALGGGHLLRETRGIDSLSGVTYGTQKRFDTLGGDTYGGHKRSPLTSYLHHQMMDKKNFDEIDRSGFDSFVKKNFDEIDRGGFDGFVKRMGYFYDPNPSHYYDSE